LFVLVEVARTGHEVFTRAVGRSYFGIRVQPLKRVPKIRA
jgi:hypothetical protein